MNKQEVIERIKNIETLSINDTTTNQKVDMVIKNQVLDIISQIDETQKVVVQKFVAEWIVSELSDLIDSCENDFEAIVFNPDGTFELLLACHAEFTHILKEATDDTEV